MFVLHNSVRQVVFGRWMLPTKDPGMVSWSVCPDPPPIARSCCFDHKFRPPFPHLGYHQVQQNRHVNNSTGLVIADMYVPSIKFECCTRPLATKPPSTGIEMRLLFHELPSHSGSMQVHDLGESQAIVKTAGHLCMTGRCTCCGVIS